MTTLSLPLLPVPKFRTISHLLALAFHFGCSKINERLQVSHILALAFSVLGWLGESLCSRMNQKSPAKSQHQKERYCIMEDVYGVMVVPKEKLQLQLQVNQISPLSHKKPLHFKPRFHVPDVGRALHDLVKKREFGEFLSGALAGAMTKAILAPLQTIRTRMVVGVGSKNIYGSFVQIMEQGGWQGLWAGNAINMLRIVPTQAIELATFEYVKRAMKSTQENSKQNESSKLQIGPLSCSYNLSWLSPVAVAGAAAGFAGTLACHPLEVLKDRLTTRPDVYPNISIAVSRIYKDGGIGALYSGLSPTLIGMLPYSTCYHFMYETIKKLKHSKCAIET